jgi:hypothetical protein
MNQDLPVIGSNTQEINGKRKRKRKTCAPWRKGGAGLNCAEKEGKRYRVIEEGEIGNGGKQQAPESDC